MKNYRYFILAAMGLMAVPALAQETYQDTKFAENGLTGTARYVGMGGAMEALGADISTMSSNPAGVGLIRKNQVSLSAGVIAQSDADTKMNFDNTPISFDGKKSVPSFDQIGIVWSGYRGNGSYVNLGFNFHKSTNFSQLLNAANYLNGASQSKTASAKTAYAKKLDIDYGTQAGDQVWNAVDANYNYLMGQDDGSQMVYDGNSFLFGQYQKGYIGVYDFNVSGSINNRVWLGLTLGIHDVHYRSNSYYTENFVQDAQNPKPSYSESWESLRITGTGFDIKAGVVFRPIENSPFRIGAYINSPVFYDLSMSGAHDLSITDENIVDEQGNVATGSSGNTVDLDYRLNTAWKAGLSLGHTVGSQLALGATYEYAWYDHMDNRVKDEAYYDSWYGDYVSTSCSDDKMNEHTQASLKGVSTLKLGLEYKPISMVALRLGYNYVSPMFNERADRDQTIPSQGTCYATSTDYINWKAINRFTCGVGFSYEKLFIDVAYQYSQQNGDFYPFWAFPSLNAPAAPATKVSNKRSQLLMTVGYKF